MSNLNSRNAHDRRTFLSALGLSTALSGLGLHSDPTVSVAADGPVELPDSLANLGNRYADIAKLADSMRYEYSWAAGNMATFSEFQATARAKLFELLQHKPAEVAPRAELLERVDCGSYTREKVTFATTSAWRVSAYVLVPKGLRDKAPAIVDLHSHGGMFLFGKEKVVDLGQNHEAMTAYHARNYDGRPTATALVERGYVVISIDAFMFGERRVLLDGDRKYGWDRSRYTLDDVKYLNDQCRQKETTLAKSLVFAGLTWPGIVAWDDLRTVDYLSSRADVDPTRIGCTGISMGGYRSLYLSALDQRIRAACVVGFMSTTRSMLRAHVDTHSWVHYLPGLHRFLDWPDLATLVAPRSLFVQQCRQDRLFPLEGMQQSLDQIAAGFKRAGCAERYRGAFYDEPHRWSRPMQDEAFAWLDQQLAHTPRV